MITVSLCMIVRNEEDTLGRCLESVGDAVEEIIVVDTGSTDKTKEIAKRYTQHVYDFEWIDDFSAARNFSYSKATMDYILFLDADDVLMPADRDKLITLKKTIDPSVDIVMMWYYVMYDEKGNETLKYYRERMSKRSGYIKWVEPVHECIVSSGKVLYTDVAISHKKIHPSNPDRNLRIYQKMIAEGREISPRGRYYYARELYYHQDYANAIEQFEAALATGQGWLEDNVSSCIMMARCYSLLNDRKNLLKALLRSFEYDIPRPEACCELGYWFKNAGDIEKARYWFLAALNYELPDQSLSFIQREHFEYIPSIELAACCWQLGRREEAVKYNEMAGKFRPNDPAVQYNRKYLAEHGPNAAT